MIKKRLKIKYSFSLFSLYLLIVLITSVQSFAGSFDFKFHSINDTNYIDSSRLPVFYSSVDSSKLFSSLLSSPNSENSFSINPEARLFADDYIRTHGSYLNNMKIWGKPYFDLYDKILSAYGLPVQLKYLSVIESSLSSTAISWAGAVGPWQIMADAAHESGLRTGNYDDRVDYVKSTNAAARILSNLYSDYKDWLLVIAAYNCGTANVDRAITKAHSRNFWNLQYYLPEETRNHVKKFIATHYYFEGNGSIVTATADEAKQYILSNALNKIDTNSLVSNCTSISVFGKYNSVVIANVLMMDISVFNALNPGFDETLAKGLIYTLRLPSDKAALFQTKKIEILKQSVELFLSSASTPTAGNK